MTSQGGGGRGFYKEVKKQWTSSTTEEFPPLLTLHRCENMRRRYWEELQGK